MEKVYDYVKSTMVWNGIYGKYSDGVKAAWSKKTGTSGDINLILVNMLRSAGLDANPVLISEREHGHVNASYPFIDQFNIVYAAVTIDDRKYYLDATNTYTPAKIIPYNILNTTGFIVNRKNGGLVEIKDEKLKYLESIFINADVEDGKLKGKTIINSDAYARVQRIGRYRRNKNKYVENEFVSETPGLKVNNFKWENEEHDSAALTQEFDFELPLNTSGDYQFINLNLFAGESQNPFISENRFSRINFGYRQFVVLNILITIPEGFAVDALPKPIKMVTPDNTLVFEKRTSVSDGRLTANVQFQINNSLFPADEYEALKSFYTKMYEYLNEPIVLKKK